MAFQPLRGFRDFYPAEMARRRHVEQAWHRAARAAGFEEIDGPPLESLDLLKAKSGDAIVEEIYAFQDKGGRDVGLRPELTPTVGRMIAEKAASLRKPIKWYAIPQLFRYQRTQKGRLREHIQWNVDIFGAEGVAADAEIVAVALDALQRLGLTAKHIAVRVNDRRQVERELKAAGVDDVPAAMTAIDRGKFEGEWLDRPLEPGEELGAFLEACVDYGVGDFMAPDKRIVRGLDYYTGIVWEIFDRAGGLRAVAGGGRYDTLVERLDGPSMPALGFGMGDVVLGDLLCDHGLLPPHPPRLDALVVPIGEAMLGPARQVVRNLRDAGLKVEAPYAPVKVGKAMKAADAAGASRVYLVGPDEWQEESVRVKDLATGEERVERLGSLS